MNRIAIISGSHRADGLSHRIAADVGSLIADHLPECEAEFLSLAELPFWDEGMWGDEALVPKWQLWQPMADRLQAADGLVIVAPEYAGMVPPRLSNFLLLCTGREVGHKPALAVAVSASRGGAYPVVQLRAYGAKNNHLCWLPDHLIVRDAKEVSLADALASGAYLGRYALYCLQLLNNYASALKSVRCSGIVDHGSFPYGM